MAKRKKVEPELEKKAEGTGEVSAKMPFEVEGRSGGIEKLRQGFASERLRPYAAAAGRRGQEARKRRMAELRAAGAEKVWTGGFKPGEAYTREMARFAINERWRKYYAEKARALEKTLQFNQAKAQANLDEARVKIATEIVPAKNEAKYMAAAIERAGSEARRVSSLIERLGLRAEQIKKEAKAAPKGVFRTPSEGRPELPALPGESRADLEKRQMQFRVPLTDVEIKEIDELMKRQRELREEIQKRTEGKQMRVVSPEPRRKREARPQTEKEVQEVIEFTRQAPAAPAVLAPEVEAVTVRPQEENLGGVAVTVLPETAKPPSLEEIKATVLQKLKEDPTFALLSKTGQRNRLNMALATEVDRLRNEGILPPSSGSQAEVVESSSQGAWMAAAALLAIVPSLGSITGFARMLEARAESYRSGALDPMVLSVDIASSPRVQRALHLARRSLGLR